MHLSTGGPIGGGLIHKNKTPQMRGLAKHIGRRGIGAIRALMVVSHASFVNGSSEVFDFFLRTRLVGLCGPSLRTMAPMVSLPFSPAKSRHVGAGRAR
jgi:hypothetical protein